MDLATAIVVGGVIVVVAVARVLRPHAGYSLRIRVDLFRGAKKPRPDPRDEDQDGAGV